MIACYGEALVDLLVSAYSHNSLRADAQACLGGSVFNFCLAAQRQGLQTAYLNALSVDLFGRQFERVLRAEGALIDSPPCREPTSMAVIELDEKGKASYAFHRHAVADTARSASDIIANWQSNVRVLHTGCLMLVPEAWSQTRQIVEQAHAKQCVVSVDANLRSAVTQDLAAYRVCVHQALASSHVLKVSDDDLVALGLLADRGADDWSEAINAARRLFLHSHTVALIALTLGERGACLLTRLNQVVLSPPERVKVQDSVGAGDSFAAALLAFLDVHHGLNVPTLSQGLDIATLQGALRHALAAATICVQRAGCDPASWDETLALTR